MLRLFRPVSKSEVAAMPAQLLHGTMHGRPCRLRQATGSFSYIIGLVLKKSVRRFGGDSKDIFVLFKLIENKKDKKIYTNDIVQYVISQTVVNNLWLFSSKRPFKLRIRL